MTPTTSRTSSIGAALVLVAALAGLALAQTADSPAAAPVASPAASAGDARKACSEAMNADPQFALDVVKIAGERAMKDPKFAGEVVKLGDEAAVKKRDADTVAAHVDANLKVQRNERHVIYAYAAMWVIAAAFVIFLWRRQRALESEILQLRRELDAAAGEGTKART
ncbi:MAG TPA: hypothetical protein VLM79_40795 [Kofleriaceae bacterium]|nr:hypothetical protein [Kofleriaceae bacterium]